MTRNISSLLGAALALAVAVPATASAQDTTRTKTDSAAAQSGMKFDPNLAVTLTGVTIVRVENGATSPTSGSPTGAPPTGMPPAGAMGGMNAGGRGNAAVQAVVQSGSDSITVTLAPAEFLASKQLSLAAGDVIDVSGMQMASGRQEDAARDRGDEGRHEGLAPRQDHGSSDVVAGWRRLEHAADGCDAAGADPADQRALTLAGRGWCLGRRPLWCRLL